jgi:glutathione S-transferase
MQLIGLLDSPYVRRVAISLQLLRLRFEHQPISVFRHIPQFRQINPVIKAPSLVCDDGTVLMDSGLILDYLEALAAPARSLMPRSASHLSHALRVIGLALAACEKSIQIVYERELRPAEKFHAPWIARVTEQLQAALEGLEQEVARVPLAATRESIDQAGITSAVTWHFIQRMIPELVPVGNFPALREHSARAEALPEFIAAPHGTDKCRNAR